MWLSDDRVIPEVLMRLGIMLAALLLTSGSSTPAHGQSAGEPSTFVAVGQKVTVHRAGGESVTGRVTRADKEGILVDAGKKQGTLQVANSDIVKIGRRSRAEGALIGLAVGFGIGFPIGLATAGYVVDENNPSTSDRLGVGIITGGFLGGIGAGFGAASGADKTIYRRR
jgi:hypothetical protein